MTILADTQVCVHTNCQRYRVSCMCSTRTRWQQTRQRGYLSPVPSLVRSRLAILSFQFLFLLYFPSLVFILRTTIFIPFILLLSPPFSLALASHLFLPGFPTLLPPSLLSSLSLSSFLELFVPGAFRRPDVNTRHRWYSFLARQHCHFHHWKR